MAWFQNISTEVFHQWPSTKITKMARLGWTKWQPELKIEKPVKDISTEVFHQWPSTKITKMAQLGWTKWRPELKIEKTFKRHLRSSQCPDFKVISQKCSSYGPLPKLLKKVLLGWTKWLLEQKIEKKKPFNISSLASGLISKWFHRNDPLISLYQNCQNGSALLNKMVTRSKNRKNL